MTWCALILMWIGGFLGGGWVALNFLSEPVGEATKQFWKGYSKGVWDERERAEEAKRPLISRMKEPVILHATSWEALERDNP